MYLPMYPPAAAVGSLSGDGVSLLGGVVGEARGWLNCSLDELVIPDEPVG